MIHICNSYRISLQSFPYIISPWEYLGRSCFTTECLHKFYLCHNTETQSKSQGWTGISLSLNRPTGHGNTTNFIQTDGEIWEKLSTKVSPHITATLNENQGPSSNWYQICLSPYQVWKKLVCECPKQTNIKILFVCLFGGEGWQKLARLSSVSRTLDLIKSTRFISLTHLNNMPNSVQIYNLTLTLDYWHNSFCFHASLWPWIKGKAT